MSKLMFSDFLTVDTSGELRLIRLSDGWYITGEGLLYPVDNPIEGNEILEDMKMLRGEKDD